MNNYKNSINLFIRFFVLMVIFVVVLLVSCENNQLSTINSSEENDTKAQINIGNNEITESTSELVTDNEKENIVYSLIQENGNYYIQASGNIIKDNQINNMELAPYIKFDNVQSFINTVQNSSYTEDQLDKLSRFSQVDGKIQIYNLEDIYYPTIDNNYAS